MSRLMLLYLSIALFSCLEVDFALVNLTSTVDADIIVMTHYPSTEKMFAHRALKLLDGLGKVSQTVK